MFSLSSSTWSDGSAAATAELTARPRAISPSETNSMSTLLEGGAQLLVSAAHVDDNNANVAIVSDPLEARDGIAYAVRSFMCGNDRGDRGGAGNRTAYAVRTSPCPVSHSPGIAGSLEPLLEAAHRCGIRMGLRVLVACGRALVHSPRVQHLANVTNVSSQLRCSAERGRSPGCRRSLGETRRLGRTAPCESPSDG